MTTTPTHDDTLEKARLANEAGFFVSVTQNVTPNRHFSAGKTRGFR